MEVWCVLIENKEKLFFIYKIVVFYCVFLEICGLKVYFYFEVRCWCCEYVYFCFLMYFLFVYSEVCEIGKNLFKL